MTRLKKPDLVREGLFFQKSLGNGLEQSLKQQQQQKKQQKKQKQKKKKKKMLAPFPGNSIPLAHLSFFRAALELN